MEHNYYFFWGGEFSQWYKSKFVVEGIEYNCAEQYMMAEKARLFKDEESLDKIMKYSSPREQKAIGRSVKNFDVNEWNNICRLVVYRGNLAKFSQNADLKSFILSTGNRYIVEASPEDKIWGIGLSESDTRIFDRNNWQGTNWLGIALMQVREDLRYL